jgi:hypothetical protein
MVRRPSRFAAAALGAAALASVLSACDKPTPNVTFLSDNTVSVVSPQTYCFDTNPDHCRFSTSKEIRVIHARGGSRILVDVPRQVATQSWTVTAATQSKNTFTALGVAGDSATVSTGHTAKVTVPFGQGNTYYLIVKQAADGKTGAWLVEVDITS